MSERFAAVASRAQRLDGFAQTLEPVSAASRYKVMQSIVDDAVYATCDGSAWFKIFDSSGPAGGGTLYEAYQGGPAGNTILMTQALGAVTLSSARTSGNILEIATTNAPATVTGTITAVAIDMSSLGTAATPATVNIPAVTIVGAHSSVAKARGAALVQMTSAYRNASATSIMVRNKQSLAGSLVQVGWDSTNYEGAPATASILVDQTHMLTLDGQTNVDAATNSVEFVGARILVPATSNANTRGLQISTLQNYGSGILVDCAPATGGFGPFGIYTQMRGSLAIGACAYLGVWQAAIGSADGVARMTVDYTGTSTAPMTLLNLDVLGPGTYTLGAAFTGIVTDLATYVVAGAQTVTGHSIVIPGSTSASTRAVSITTAQTAGIIFAITATGTLTAQQVGVQVDMSAVPASASIMYGHQIKMSATSSAQSVASYVGTIQTAGTIFYANFTPSVGSVTTTNDMVGLGLDMLTNVRYGGGDSLLVQGINVRVGQSSHGSCRTVVGGGRMTNASASVAEFYLDPNVTSNANVLKLYTNANHQSTALGNGALLYGRQDAAAGRGIYIETGSFAGAFSGSTLFSVYRQGTRGGGGTETYALSEIVRSVSVTGAATLNAPLFSVYSGPTLDANVTFTYAASEATFTRAPTRNNGTLNLSGAIVSIAHTPNPASTINADTSVGLLITMTPSGSKAVVGASINMSSSNATGAALTIAHSGTNANQLVFTSAPDGTGAHIYGPTTGQLNIFAGLRADAGTGRSVAIYAGDGVSSTNGGGDVLLAGGDPVSTGSYGYVKAQTAFAETSSAVSYTASGTTTINVSLGNSFTATVATGITTWAFSNPPASGLYYGFTLTLTNGGAFAQTWPASVKWPGGGAPVLTVSGVDVLVFFTIDGGTTWRGVVAQADSR